MQFFGIKPGPVTMLVFATLLVCYPGLGVLLGILVGWVTWFWSKTCRSGLVHLDPVFSVTGPDGAVCRSERTNVRRGVATYVYYNYIY